MQQIVISKSQIIMRYFHFRESEAANIKNSFMYCVTQTFGMHTFQINVLIKVLMSSICSKFMFYRYPFIVGTITTEFICFFFFTSAAIVFLSSVFYKLSFFIAKCFYGYIKLYIQAVLQDLSNFSLLFVDCTFIAS